MAKRKSDVNKSEEIRQALKANPSAKAREIVALLAEKGIQVAASQIYFVKGTLKGRNGRKKDAAPPSSSNGSVNGDVVATILKVKGLATELGGFKKLQTLVELLSE